MNTFPIGVQPYTIRREMDKDYTGALTRVASIGYKGVELGRPPVGMTVKQQKSLLDDLGLKVVGTHGPFDSFDFQPDEIADYLDAVDGGRYVAMSLRFGSKDEVLEKARKLNEVGDAFRRRGITLLYHNHNWEFEQFDGEYILDILMRETDPTLVQTELDTYWIARGGVNPTEYMAKFKNRAPLLHIKDVDKEDGSFAEIGEGSLDFVQVADVAKSIGVQWLIVEQDESKRDPFTSLEISYRNLRKLGIMQD